jgi:hypothetical protein
VVEAERVDEAKTQRAWPCWSGWARRRASTRSKERVRSMRTPMPTPTLTALAVEGERDGDCVGDSDGDRVGERDGDRVGEFNVTELICDVAVAGICTVIIKCRWAPDCHQAVSHDSLLSWRRFFFVKSSISNTSLWYARCSSISSV